MDVVASVEQVLGSGIAARAMIRVLLIMFRKSAGGVGIANSSILPRHAARLFDARH
jgi:hypothetical protein